MNYKDLVNEVERLRHENDVLSAFINREMGMTATDPRIEDLKNRLVSTPPSSTSISLSPMTRKKFLKVMDHKDYKVTGVVISAFPEICICDNSAVRWITTEEWWKIMHPTNNENGNT